MPKSRRLSSALTLLMIVIAVIGLNLPPKKVSDAVDLNKLEEEDLLTRVARNIALKILVSDSVAGWRYRDFLTVKVATSKPLGFVAIGFPFSGWRLYEEKGGNQRSSRR